MPIIKLLPEVDNPINATSQVWQGGVSGVSVAFIATLIGDSGMAGTEPAEWNASALGCFFVGLQPRGGWQIMQRAMQWGEGNINATFDVKATKRAVYAYFASSIRDRIEVWKSDSWESPMSGLEQKDPWKRVGTTNVMRPTSLHQGSRGDHTFICEDLLPIDNARYSCEETSRKQMLSVMLVAAAFMDHKKHENVTKVMRDEFEVNSGLGLAFKGMFIILIIVNGLSLGFTVTMFYSLFKRNLYGESAPYLVQLCAWISWVVGATGLLMLGGKPYVKIVSKHSRIPDSMVKILNGKSDSDSVKLGFDLANDSIRLNIPQGHCELPASVVRTICSWELELVRSPMWILSAAWWTLMLLLSITLQVTASDHSTLLSEVFAVAILMVTSLFRGYGLSGSLRWVIPQSRRRKTSEYGEPEPELIRGTV